MADRFLETARAALAEACTTLELDVGAVTFLDSTGIGALVRLRQEALAAGKAVVLTHAPRQVIRVLDLTGLSEVFLDRPGR